MRRLRASIALAAVACLFVLAPAAYATTFTVNTTADHAEDGCADLPDDCTLREAINASNADTSTSDTINFTVLTAIQPGSELPAVLGPTTIDGGAAPVELDGSSAGVGADGIVIQAGVTL